MRIRRSTTRKPFVVRDDRIDIDLDDLRNSVGKLAETNEESFEGGMIRHRRSAVAVEER